LSVELPPKSTPVLVKQFNGRILSGIVTEIDHQREVLKLSRVTRLEVVGLDGKLDSIYGKRRRSTAFLKCRLTLLFFGKSYLTI
jgi:hypothetical protein